MHSVYSQFPFTTWYHPHRGTWMSVDCCFPMWSFFSFYRSIHITRIGNLERQPSPLSMEFHCISNTVAFYALERTMTIKDEHFTHKSMHNSRILIQKSLHYSTFLMDGRFHSPTLFCMLSIRLHKSFLWWIFCNKKRGKSSTCWKMSWTGRIRLFMSLNWKLFGTGMCREAKAYTKTLMGQCACMFFMTYFSFW